MKEKYIELMARTLSAYTEEHIHRYFNSVKANGLTEHGFPRLTSNIGILIAHKYRLDLTDIFIEMMDFCCKSIPHVKAANDFSVREVIVAIRELEASAALPCEILDRWKKNLSEIDPTVCYDVCATKPYDRVKNWALFSCLSEFFRQKMGLCDSQEFIDRQIEAQLRWIDENGMYMDGEGVKHHPINYDIVPRGLFALLLSEGYRGKYYNVIDEFLRKSALLTLKMQSPNGEMAFGGRSNQFLYTEEWMIVIYEYEARRYAREQPNLAKMFKAASSRALAVTDYWLKLDPIRHIRNRFPTETKHGCEDYAYFDKYMITVASNLHAAYMVCDDSICIEALPDIEPSIFETSKHFHKLFAKAGGYGIEFDLDADTHYDANGLGRVHRAGAPASICLSVPCPENPIYTVTVDKPIALSLAPVISVVTTDKCKWQYGSSAGVCYDVLSTSERENSAIATLRCYFGTADFVDSEYTVSEDGVSILSHGDGIIGFTLPAFYFDGEEYTNIKTDDSSLTIEYKGWICKYSTDGKIEATDRIAANRNGYYKEFLTIGKDLLNIKIKILKKED